MMRSRQAKTNKNLETVDVGEFLGRADIPQEANKRVRQAGPPTTICSVTTDSDGTSRVIATQTGKERKADAYRWMQAQVLIKLFNIKQQEPGGRDDKATKSRYR